MFPTPASVVGEPSGYDFQKEENAAKWKGVFVNSLRKVNLSLDSSRRFISLYLFLPLPSRSLFLSPSPSFPCPPCFSLSSISLWCPLLSRPIPSTSPPSLLHFLFARTLDHFSSRRSYVEADSINDTDLRHRLARATHHMIFQIAHCQYLADTNMGPLIAPPRASARAGLTRLSTHSKYSRQSEIIDGSDTSIFVHATL